MFSAETTIQKYGPEKEVKLEDYETEIIEYVESVEKMENSIGIGRTAEVFYSKTNPGMCFKIIHDKEFYQNDVIKEGHFLDKVEKIKSTVKTPRPYYALINVKKDYHVLVMEKLNAFSVEDLMEGREENLPAGFDRRKFINELKEFFQIMHEQKKIFHRDAHGGNIMIERETGRPCVIDFGTAKESYISTENPYIYVDAIGKGALYTDDLVRLDNIKKDLINYIAEQKSLDK
ncbi:MAG: AarF/UbiB family protein [Parcubacteria group bacterium]|jgi:serine/threonine protein kinase